MDEAPSRRAALRLAGTALLAGTATGCAERGPVVVPDTILPPIPGAVSRGWPTPGFAARQFRARVTVLNAWASWCGYCRGEHPLLGRLARDPRFVLAGLVVEDTPAKASAYLREAGNPFAALAHDRQGRLPKLLGQRGVPNSYVIGPEGRVELHLRGALSEGWIEGVLERTLRRVLGQA